MRDAHLWVLVWLRRGDDGEPRVVRYGPTSYQAGLLIDHDCREPSTYDVRAVVRTTGGMLLRARLDDCQAALARWEAA